MKKLITFIAFSMLFIPAMIAGRVTVVDGSDGSPVIGATVFSSSGLILGATDADGNTPDVNEASYPLTIHSLGYKEGIAATPGDTLMMNAAAYDLPPVTVMPGERPITRVVCYVREYSTGATDRDTLKMYSEYMVESYHIDEGTKVKGYHKYDFVPKTRTERRFAHYTGADGRDSVATPEDDEYISFMNFLVSLPVDVFEEPDTIKNGALTDTVQGRYSPGIFYKKTPEFFVTSLDMLSNYKNHVYSPNVYKFFGLTIDIREMNLSFAYKANPSGKYNIHDFLYEISSANILGRGKWIKKAFKTKNPVEIDSNVEVYPVEINYLTVDEYKEQRKEHNKLEFRIPDNALPVLPSVQRLIDRINTAGKDTK
jgi:hypothetical protein